MKNLFSLIIVALILVGTFCLAIPNSTMFLIKNDNCENFIRPAELSEVLEASSYNLFNNNHLIQLYPETPENIKIILNSVNVFETADINSEIIGRAYYGEVFPAISKQSDFYEIEFTAEVNGFVLTAFALDENLKSPKIILDTNAIVINSSFVYKLNGTELTKVDGIVLEASTRIKILEGYDTAETYCKATFDFEDETYTYYILTENINPDGISSRFVTAIMLIIVCVSIFLILYSFFRGRTRK